MAPPVVHELGALLLLASRGAASPAPFPGQRGAAHKNVLFVIIDDLRHQLHSAHAVYGRDVSFMRTPHIDRFASEALVARRAHVQQALCGPSRASILTGRRPETTGVVVLEDYFRDTGCDGCVTLPELFKSQGYFTFGSGKVFHDGAGSGRVPG